MTLDVGKEILPRSGGVALVDTSDYDRLANRPFRWSLSRKGYAVCTIWNKTEKKVITHYLHREVVGAPKGMLVDHRNGDSLDNRRGNLRLCGAQENTRNRLVHRSTASGYKGVYATSPSCVKWLAQIEAGGVIYRLGLFASKEDAANAYDAKARELFRDFATLNFPRDGERSARRIVK